MLTSRRRGMTRAVAPGQSSGFRVLWTSVLPSVKTLWPAYVVASLLILYGFAWGLPVSVYQDKSFHADENAKVWIVNQISFPYFYAGLLSKGTALLYQVFIAKTVLTLGGLLPTSSYLTLTIGRSIVYLYALGTLTLTYFLGRTVFDGRTGRLAALILATLPGFVINSHYFKADVPVTFWIMASMLAAYRLLSSARVRDAAVLGLLAGYSVSTKYSAAPLLPSGLVAIALADRRLKKGAAALWFAAFAALGFFLGTPYAVLLPSKLIASLQWVTALNRTGIPYHIARAPGWIDYAVNVFPYSMTAPLLALAVLGVVWTLATQGWRLLPIWVFLSVYYLLLGADNWRLVRYTVPLLPFLALCTARFINDLRERRGVRLLAVGGLSFTMVYAFVFSLAYVRAMARPDPRVQAGQWIERHLPRATPVPVIPDHYTNLPQLRSIGYTAEDVGHSVERLRSAPSPYLVLSESGVQFYEEAIAHYPRQAAFLAYVRAHYERAAYFENSQALLGINSKRGRRLPQDWLHPNTAITILKRKGAP